MFHPHAYVGVVGRYPHGQTIHVRIGRKCIKWVVMDDKRAVNFDRYGTVLMNWTANDRSKNVHWEWECG
jgi:hypothetical protein